MTPAHLAHNILDAYRPSLAQHIFALALAECDSFHAVVTVVGVFRLSGREIAATLLAILPRPADDAQVRAYEQLKDIVG